MSREQMSRDKEDKKWYQRCPACFLITAGYQMLSLTTATCDAQEKITFQQILFNCWEHLSSPDVTRLHVKVLLWRTCVVLGLSHWWTVCGSIHTSVSSQVLDTLDIPWYSECSRLVRMLKSTILRMFFHNLDNEWPFYADHVSYFHKSLEWTLRRQ